MLLTANKAYFIENALGHEMIKDLKHAYLLTNLPPFDCQYDSLLHGLNIHSKVLKLENFENQTAYASVVGQSPCHF